MDIELREEVYKKAINKWGERAQYEMAQEEADELALAVRKYYRNPSLTTYDNMVEEIADVEIMIEQIKMMHRNKNILKKIEIEKISKVNRLNERINKSQFN